MVLAATRRVSLPNMAGGGRCSLVPTIRSSQAAGKGKQRGSERAEIAPGGTTLHVGVCSVRQWPGDGESWSDRAGRGRGGVAERISQAAHLSTGRGRFLETWNIRETHPKGAPVRTLVRYRMRTPDPALPEDAQNINKLAHILRKDPLHRTGRPGTTDEQRAKDTESTRAAPQESGGQIQLIEDEIGIYETDLAESMAIWGFGEDDENHMSFQ